MAGISARAASVCPMEPPSSSSAGPCRSMPILVIGLGRGPDPPTGLAVIDLMAALAAQPMRGAGTPIDRRANFPVANRWAGMAVELTVPDDINFADCDGGQFRSWGPENNARSNQGPGQRDLVWAVDGTGKGVKYGFIGAHHRCRFFPGHPGRCHVRDRGHPGVGRRRSLGVICVIEP